MMGSQDDRQDHFLYNFRLEDHVPQDHLLRRINEVLYLSGLRRHLEPFYSHTGRPSIDGLHMASNHLVVSLYPPNDGSVPQLVCACSSVFGKSGGKL
jgi:hypothetical protein